MRTDIICRQLSADDLPLVRELLAVFADAFDDRVTYLQAQPDDRYLQALLAQPHVIVIAAIRAGAVVGGLAAYELEKLEQARSEIYIYDLAVADGWRRRGVATALIRELERIGASRGAWVIFVQADPTDPPAIALYESLGTREDVHHFDIQVRRKV